MIYILLFISILINFFFCWFLYRSLDRQASLVSLVEDLQFKIDFFKKHLEGLYELEVFYGEPTIQNLIEHSKLLLSSFEQFNEDYGIFIGEEDSNDELQEKAQDKE